MFKLDLKDRQDREGGGWTRIPQEGTDIRHSTRTGGHRDHTGSCCISPLLPSPSSKEIYTQQGLVSSLGLTREKVEWRQFPLLTLVFGTGAVLGQPRAGRQGGLFPPGWCLEVCFCSVLPAAARFGRGREELLMTMEPKQISCHSQTVGFGDSDTRPGQGRGIIPSFSFPKAFSYDHRET